MAAIVVLLLTPPYTICDWKHVIYSPHFNKIVRAYEMYRVLIKIPKSRISIYNIFAK